ncbi:MAG: hypothetical protein JXA66_01190 [Oligoflexia bacterium]|nr:hypothetical protein [Oligoflexia bacterium]
MIKKSFLLLCFCIAISSCRHWVAPGDDPNDNFEGAERYVSISVLPKTDNYYLLYDKVIPLRFNLYLDKITDKRVGTLYFEPARTDPEKEEPFDKGRLLFIDMDHLSGTFFNNTNEPKEKKFIDVITHNLDINLIKFMNLIQYKAPDEALKAGSGEAAYKTLVFSKCEINNLGQQDVYNLVYDVTCTEQQTENTMEAVKLGFDLTANVVAEYKEMNKKASEETEISKNKARVELVSDLAYVAVGLIAPFPAAKNAAGRSEWLTERLVATGFEAPDKPMIDRLNRMFTRLELDSVDCRAAAELIDQSLLSVKARQGRAATLNADDLFDEILLHQYPAQAKAIREAMEDVGIWEAVSNKDVANKIKELKQARGILDLELEQLKIYVFGTLAKTRIRMKERLSGVTQREVSQLLGLVTDTRHPELTKAATYLDLNRIDDTAELNSLKILLEHESIREFTPGTAEVLFHKITKEIGNSSMPEQIYFRAFLKTIEEEHISIGRALEMIDNIRDTFIKAGNIPENFELPQFFHDARVIMQKMNTRGSVRHMGWPHTPEEYESLITTMAKHGKGIPDETMSSIAQKIIPDYIMSIPYQENEIERLKKIMTAIIGDNWNNNIINVTANPFTDEIYLALNMLENKILTRQYVEEKIAFLREIIAGRNTLTNGKSTKNINELETLIAALENKLKTDNFSGRAGRTRTTGRRPTRSSYPPRHIERGIKLDKATADELKSYRELLTKVNKLKARKGDTTRVSPGIREFNTQVLSGNDITTFANVDTLNEFLQSDNGIPKLKQEIERLKNLPDK